MNIRIEGKLENLGKTMTGGLGAEIRGADGRLSVVSGLTPDQLRELGSMLFQSVAITVSSAEAVKVAA